MNLGMNLDESGDITPILGNSEESGDITPILGNSGAIQGQIAN